MHHVFVLGDDAHHRERLRRLPVAADCEFHALFDRDEVRGVDEFRVGEWLDEARCRLDRSGVTPSGIVSWWDFPVTELAAILAGEHGLPAPTLDALVRSQHKLVSRRLQREVIPEAVPAFEAVDVWSDDAVADLRLPFPFWLKPVRSFRSHLGFRVGSRRDLAAAVRAQRDGLARIVHPYQELLDHASTLDVRRGPGAAWALAEGIVTGRQCTLEGWAGHGEVEVYGAVDSIRGRNRRSFARYQYPSRLPPQVLERMTRLAEAVVRRTGLDDGPFNAELFWDRRRDRIWFLELNARASQSHFDLFELVDGRANAEVALDLALGRRPHPARQEGPWPLAAKCFLRAFVDAVVTRVPSPERIAEVEAAVPGTVVRLEVARGQRLSELLDQEPYSYELGHVIVPGRSPRDVSVRFDRVRELLGVELRDVGP